MPPQATAEAKRRSTGHRPKRPPHKTERRKGTGHRPPPMPPPPPQATGHRQDAANVLPPFFFCACFPQAAADAAKGTERRKGTGHRRRRCRHRCHRPHKRHTPQRAWAYCASTQAYKEKLLKREFDVGRKVLLYAKLTWTEFSMWNRIRVIQILGRHRNGVIRLSSCICEMQCVTIFLENGVGRLILYAAWVNSTDGQTIWAIMDGRNVPSVALPGRTTT